MTLLAAIVSGCSSSSNGASNVANCTQPGGPVTGPDDGHCSGPSVIVDPGVCSAPPVATDAGTSGAEYGDTLFNDQGDDDDCKYKVQWSATTICENADVTVQVKLTALSDGASVPGANPWADVFLGAPTHPAPLTQQSSHETAPGNYSIGPIRFDAKGQWTMRFHFFANSCDQPASPHGHAAFYVNVP